MNRQLYLPFHYGWVIAGTTFFLMLVAAGVRSTPGVLIIPIEQEFGWNRAAITLAIGINLLLYGLSGPFVASLMQRYGIRMMTALAMCLLAVSTFLTSWMSSLWQFYLLWGVAVGVGTGVFLTVLGTLVANRWFEKNRGFVIGLLTASSATGQLAFLPFLAHLVEGSGWKAAVWTVSAAAALMIPAVLVLMRNSPSDLGLLPYGAISETETVFAQTNPISEAFKGLRMAIRSLPFWLLSASFFICGLSTSGLIGTHFIPASVHHGIPEVKAAGILAMMGVFDIIGTLVSGWLSDRFNNRWLLFWYYSLRGLSLLFLPYALSTGNASLLLFAVFYGLDWVATVPPTVRITTDLFGPKHTGVVYGWIFAAHQAGAGAAAFGGGALYTLLQSYFFTFLTAGIMCVLAALMVIKIPRNDS